MKRDNAGRRRPVLILASSFVNSVIIGSVWSVGIWNVVFLDEFQESIALTAWIGSVMYTAYCFSGVLAGLMARRFSCRGTVFFGGVLSTLGCILASVSISMWPLFLTFGLMTGAGLGMANLGNVAILSEYFTRYIGPANAVTSTGIPVGTILSAVYLQLLLDHYTWRQAMLLYSGILLQMCVFASLLRPNRKHGKSFLTTVVDMERGSKESLPLKPNPEENSADMLHENLNMDDIITIMHSSPDMNSAVLGMSDVACTETKGDKSNLKSADGIPDDSTKALLNPTKRDLMTVSKWWTFFKSNRSYLWFCASVTLAFFSVSVICVHLPADAKSRGYSNHYANALILYAGIGSVVSRVSVAVTTSYHHSEFFLFFNYLIQMGTASLFTSAMPLYADLEGSHIAFSVLFGVFAQSHAALLPPITQALVGSDNVQVALGLVYTVASAPLIAAPTFAGFICDVTRSYDGTYYLTGATLFSSFWFGVVSLLYKRRNDRTKDKANTICLHLKT